MRTMLRCVSLAAARFLLFSAAQGHQPTPQRAHEASSQDAAAVERGRALFKSSLRLLPRRRRDRIARARSGSLRHPGHDDNGNLLGPVIRNGRPGQRHAQFRNLKDDQITDIVAFLHHQANAALHSAHVPGDYPLAKLADGNAQAGKAYFDGAGGCSGAIPSPATWRASRRNIRPSICNSTWSIPRPHVAKPPPLRCPTARIFEGKWSTRMNSASRWSARTAGTGPGPQRCQSGGS